MQRFLLVGIIIFSFLTSFSQDDKERKWTLNGYISYMNTNTFDSISNAWSIDNQLHNRLNFEYYFNDNFIFTSQLRTRFMYGNTFLIAPNYGDLVATETGILPLNHNVLSGDNYILNMNMDRLFVKYTKGDWDISIGRQRINWGRTLIWNPNDIFNTYSYFDFDYEERAGSDAIRVQYYTGAASSIEFAASVNHEERMTAAAKLLVNKWDYDWQFILGEMEQRDYVAGMGWAGAIKNFGFRGEATYFMPINSKDTNREASLSATASLDYTFSNSLNIMMQVLYSEITNDNPISNFSTFYSSNLNAKYLSFTDWNMFVSASYPITPLMKISLAGMYYPNANSLFINPSIDYSLSDNLEFSFIYQYFKGESMNPLTGSIDPMQVNLAFLRLKMSF